MGSATRERSKSGSPEVRFEHVSGEACRCVGTMFPLCTIVPYELCDARLMLLRALRVWRTLASHVPRAPQKP